MTQDIFSALSDPTRRAILDMLRTENKSLSDISAQFDMSRPAVSKHIKVLEQADLITIAQDGRHRIHCLNPDGLRPAYDWLQTYEAFWDEKLSSLKSLIEGENS